jgi:hypothetical protein
MAPNAIGIHKTEIEDKNPSIAKPNTPKITNIFENKSARLTTNKENVIENPCSKLIGLISRLFTDTQSKLDLNTL